MATETVRANPPTGTVVLDVNTGEIAAEHQIEQQPDRQGFQRSPDIGPSTSNIGAPQTGVHHLTEDTRVVYQLDDGFHVQARDLNDDEVVWTNDEAVDSPGESLEEGGRCIRANCWWRTR